MPAEYNGISVTRPVGEAIERAKSVLFRPFDPGKWLVIGFCAWLAFLGEGGGGGGGGFNAGNWSGHDGHGPREVIERALRFIMENLWWLAPLAAGIILISLAIWIVLLWLSSRGQFMFLHCVARNVGEVEVPWVRYSKEANSLFLFRTAVSVCGSVATLPLVFGLVAIILSMVIKQRINAPGVFLCIGLFMLILILGIGFWVLGRLIKDFIVPLQYLRRIRVMHAWREFLGLFRGRLGDVVVYLLFRIVISIVISALVLTVVLVTCCIAGCLLAIPYLGTVLLLPILVFERAYSAHFLAQFGPSFDVFSSAESIPLTS